jgi:hypothetical protein
MPEQSDPKKNEPSQAAALAASAQSAAGTKSAGAARFLEAFNNYLRRLGEAWEAARQGAKDSHGKHDTAQRALRAETEKLYIEPSRRYAEEMRDAWRGPVEDRHRAVMDVHHRFQSTVHDAMTSAVQRAQTVHGELQQATSAARDAYTESCRSAFKSFLGDLKHAWHSVDVGQLDLATLADIQRITNQAAHCAWHTGVT